MKKKSARLRTDFDIAGEKSKISKIEAKMQNPDFWKDRENAKNLSQELAQLKRNVGKFESLNEEYGSLKELITISGKDEKILEEINKKVEDLEEEVKSQETEMFFSDKYDKSSAVLSVYSGAGGKDAEDWAAILLRMYNRFAENKGWKAKMIHEHWGEYQGPGGWGIKNAAILIKGAYAYGYLRRESGVHRLVRISPFSAQKLRHTSFALVDVMPEFVAPEEVEIKPEDLKIDFFRSSGPGGQNVNKRETAVRITHLPTGAQIASQSERSQERNREIAMELLRSKLYQMRLEEQEKDRRGIRNEKVSVEWGSQIRSYVMHPYQMVKDHRTGIETSNIDRVLDGGLEEFIKTEIKN